jgi:hypothetical protein
MPAYCPELTTSLRVTRCRSHLQGGKTAKPAARGKKAAAPAPRRSTLKGLIGKASPASKPKRKGAAAAAAAVAAAAVAAEVTKENVAPAASKRAAPKRVAAKPAAGAGAAQPVLAAAARLEPIGVELEQDVEVRAVPAAHAKMP